MSTMTSKIIEILDPQSGEIRETERNIEKSVRGAPLFEVKRGARPMTLLEASNTADFPFLLKDGLRTILFDFYTRLPATWPDFVPTLPSDKMSEDWVEEHDFGELPVVHEDNEYPQIQENIDRTINIRNFKRGMLLDVTEEMIKFNRTALLTRRTQKLARAAVRTRERAVYSVLTTGANYIRTVAAGDNDIGNNTATLTFSGIGLNTALSTLRTMKDQKSGSFLGVNPDTLIVTPRLEAVAKQLLLSPFLGGMGDKDATIVHGIGTTNPFRGQIQRIIVTPEMGNSYQWALLEKDQALVLQEVEGLQLLQTAMNATSSEYIKFDHIQFRVRDWFGVGMLNDRFAFYSDSSTAGTID